jgi:methylated-DNA-[protein]-cysteine S-methyltransferase
MYSSTVATPAGPFSLVIDGEAVLASGWTADPAVLLPLIHPSLRPVAAEYRAELGAFTRAVTAYHAGDLQVIGTIPVRQQSGEFLVQAWKVLRDVPAGQPVTYSEFAQLAGRPAAIRAAASACARNAAALFVPCHRVLRIGGALGGFRWGTATKRWLLDHENPAAKP